MSNTQIKRLASDIGSHAESLAAMLLTNRKAEAFEWLETMADEVRNTVDTDDRAALQVVTEDYDEAMEGFRRP